MQTEEFNKCRDKIDNSKTKLKEVKAISINTREKIKIL